MAIRSQTTTAARVAPSSSVLRAVIGNNYNLVREGIEIELPLPWEMSAEELAVARIKHQQWNAAGRW